MRKCNNSLENNDSEAENYESYQIENSESETEDNESCMEQGESTTFELKKQSQIFFSEIYDLLNNHEEVNYKNALEINKKMQTRLVLIRSQIQTLLVKVKQSYIGNEQILRENMLPKKRTDGRIYGKISKGEKFYIKGNTFFKDLNGRNAPNNNDYVERKNQGEVFPMDFELTSRQVWSITDKMSIVKGIKEQIVCYKKFRKPFEKMKLAAMLKEVEEDFNIDWMQISMYNLRYRHTPTSCQAMWEVYLKPTLKHDTFSNDENDLLKTAAKKFNYQNWQAIAFEVGARSDYQCFLQYYTTPTFRQRCERWAKSDDDLLIKTVNACKYNGVVNWAQVAYSLPFKTKSSLKQRYEYVLNPVVSHAPFTGEEDLILLAAVKEYGLNFAKFPRSLFPNRSVIQLRSRFYNTLQNRHKICPWTLEDDKLLLKYVEENGISAWKKCAIAMSQRHSRTSCRQRYFVLRKYLDADNLLENISRRSLRMMHSDVTTENWLGKIEELQANPHLNASESTKPTSSKKAQKRTLIMSNQQNEEGKDEMLTQVVKTITKNTVEHNEPPLKKYKTCSKSSIYLKSLRSNGIQFHNFFKYSYNFGFGKSSQLTSPKIYLTESNKAIDCLGFQLPNCNINVNSNTANLLSYNVNGLHCPSELRKSQQDLLHQRTRHENGMELAGSIDLTPNFSTLVALRAFCVLLTDKKNKDTNSNCSAPQIKHQNELSADTFNNLSIIKRFRKRFHAIFNQTALLIRFAPNSIPNELLKNSSLINESLCKQNLKDAQNTSTLVNQKLGQGIKTEFSHSDN